MPQTKLNLKDIELYSKCPAYYNYSRSVLTKPIPEDLSIIKQVIERAYTKDNKTDYKASWRTIVGWVNQLVFKSRDVHNPSIFEQGTKLAQSILQKLQNWYYKEYIYDQVVCFPQLQLELHTTNTTIQCDAPLVKLDNTPVIVSYGVQQPTKNELSRSLHVFGLATALGYYLDSPAINYHYRSILLKTEHTVDIEIDSGQMQKTIEMISNIAETIHRKIFFPSMTQQCHSCPFKKRCSI